MPLRSFGDLFDRQTTGGWRSHGVSTRSWKINPACRKICIAWTSKSSCISWRGFRARRNETDKLKLDGQWFTLDTSVLHIRKKRLRMRQMLCKHYFSSCIFCINYDFIVLYVASLSWSVLAFSESLPLQIFSFKSISIYKSGKVQLVKYRWLWTKFRLVHVFVYLDFETCTFHIHIK